MSAKFLKGIDLNGQRAVNAGDASGANDLVTKQQLDAGIRGLSWKQAVRVASTGTVTLASPGTTIDGVTLAANDRVLLKDQATGSQNGIYVWTASGSPLTRAVDADASAEIDSMAVFVESGTVNADRMYVLSTDNPVLDTTALVYSQLGGGGVYTAGAGLVGATTFDVGAGTGITVAADSIAVDTNVVVRKFAASCVVTTNPQTFAHGLGTADLVVTIKESTAVVYPDVTIDATNVTVDWGGAPTSAQYRVIAHG
jgi:hypothetical protein